VSLWPADSMRPTDADIASARAAYTPAAATVPERGSDAIDQAAHLREVAYYLDHALSHIEMLAAALAEGKVLTAARIVRMMRARAQVHHEAIAARTPERLRELAETQTTG
jgi:hypothetical protein